MSDYLVTDTELTGIANAIRTKGGTSSALSFPSGFESAIGAITTGKDYVSGTFTCPDEDTTQTINFGKTINNYLFIIEMTNDSKSALVSSATSSTITIAFFGVYPKRSINGKTVASNAASERYVASSDSTTAGTTTAVTCSNSSIQLNVNGLDATTPQSNLIRGYSYNYTVVSLD